MKSCPSVRWTRMRWRGAARAASDLLHRRRRAGDDAGIHRNQFTAGGLRAHLYRAGGIEYVHEHEGVRDGLRRGQQTMVAEHEEGLVPEITHEPRLLVLVE